MKSLFFFLIVFCMVTTSCDDQKRENALKLKETELNQKDQELLVREKSIELKEKELSDREKLLDSVSNSNVADTLSALYPELPGVYNVAMRCTETTCTGSAVGDTKNEQWDIAFENNTVLIKAMSDKKLVRIYRGSYAGSSIELIAQQDNTATPQAGNMIVRLQPAKDSRLKGTREITGPESCRIIYNLDLQKQ